MAALVCMAAAALGAVRSVARAQEFPDHAVKIIVPISPSG
jgi:tripartite-type tricarboxylate transporter receptor subunit TctC